MKTQACHSFTQLALAAAMTTALSAAMTLAPGAAQAAAVVPAPLDAGQVLRQFRELDRLPMAPAPAVPPLHAPATPFGPDQGPTVTPRRFVVEGGDEILSPDEVQTLLAPALGRPLTLGALRRELDGVSRAYRERGYFLARALLPAQEVKDGVVRVLIQPGRLDAEQGVRLAAAQGGKASRMKPQVAQDILRAAVPDEGALRLQDLERGLQILNDQPGVQAAGHLEPGSTPGSTRLVLAVNDTPLWQAQVGADNHGSRYTRSERLSARLGLNNPSGHAEQFTLLAQASPQGDYRLAQLGASLLAHPMGLRVGATASQLRYRVGQELAALQAGGSAQVLGLNLRQPLLRDRQQGLHLSAGLERKRLRNHSLGETTADKTVDSANLGLQYERSDAEGSGGVTQLSASLAAGRLDLGAHAPTLAQDQAAQGPRTHGRFNLLQLSGLRLQRLPGPFSLLAQLHGQAGSKNLDSAEKFVLGGPAGVRAYPSGEAAGDSGLRAAADLRWHLGPVLPWGELQLSAFVDAGWVRQWQQPQALALSTPNQYRLAGAGLGAGLTLPQGLDLQLAWAAKLGGNPGRNPSNGHDADGRSAASRLWLNLQARF